MLRRFSLLLLLLATGCSVLNGSGSGSSGSGSGGSGSGGSGSGSSGSGSTSATYVYVSTTSTSSSGSSTYAVDGYTAGSDGALTAISGSPFPTTGYGALTMAAQGAMLFGSDGYAIDSFSIGPGGALKQVSTVNVGDLSSTQPPEPIGGPVNLFFDAGGTNLYDGFENIDGTENNGYQAFSADMGTGAVTLVGSAGSQPALGSPLAFAGNNEFAFTSSCYHGTAAISGFERGSNGALTQLSTAGFSSMPTAPSGDTYCPLGAAADSSSHLIISVGVTPPDSVGPTGPWQLAIYTVNSSGGVSTASTAASMPTTNVGQPSSYLLSPDDKYLAVGGESGLQLYAYDSSTAALTALGSADLTTDTIQQVAWDTSDHLYALAPNSNSLYVYAVSATGATAVSGSPYAENGAYALAVTTVTTSGSGS